MGHSQNGEERIIYKYVDDGKTYVDIGAGHCSELSNTYELYERGWRGVLVEPYHIYHEDISKFRPEDKLCKKVITDYVGEMEMFSTAAGNTFIGDDYKKFGTAPYKVPCYTMKEFCEEYPEFTSPDFCSIDIETGEENMLRCTDFNIFKPRLICIEYRVRNVDYSPNWAKYITPYYEPKELVAHNAFYLRRA